MAFKVPLDHRYDSVIKKQDRLAPCDVISHYHSTGINLRMVVDLTDTEKYYSADLWGPQVQYIKMNLPGQTVPNKEYVQRFLDVVLPKIKELSLENN